MKVMNLAGNASNRIGRLLVSCGPRGFLYGAAIAIGLLAQPAIADNNVTKLGWDYLPKMIGTTAWKFLGNKETPFSIAAISAKSMDGMLMVYCEEDSAKL